MNDWVVEEPSVEEDLLNSRYIMLNQNGVNEVVELIKNKNKEIERLNNIINELHKLIEQDWGYYGSFVYNSRAEFDDEEQVTKFWQDYGKKEIIKKYRNKIKELKGDGSNE